MRELIFSHKTDRSICCCSGSVLRRFFSMVIFWCVLFCLPVHAQKFLSDTLFIDFHPDTMITIRNLHIAKVTDVRHEDPRFIRYFTRNKYLLFPVDEEVLIHRPLAKVLVPIDSSGTAHTDSLVIRKFRVEKQNYRFSYATVLSADIALYSHINDTVKYKGTFYYDYIYQHTGKKEPVTKVTENLLHKWHTQFKLDLLSVNASGLQNEAGASNFITDPKVKSLYLNSMATVFFGINWWGVQGEMYFTRPETTSKNRVQATMVRYQDNDLYQSIAFGRKAEHLTGRLTQDLSTDADLNILLGLCRWKNIEVNKPKLYQVFDIGLSSIQSLLYNPLNKKSFLFRVGLIENLQYVIDRSPRLQVGLVVGAGYKF